MPPVAIGAAIVGTGLAIKAYGDYKSNQAKSRAAGKAADLQAQLAREQMANLGSAGERGYNLVGDAGTASSSMLRDYYARAKADLGRGYDTATTRYGSGIRRAKSDITSNYGSAMSSLNAGYDAASGRLSPLAGLSRYGEMAVSTPLGANFEADPGYQFRLEQGNQALQRMGAAAGGRISGAAMKKGMEYNQGFASNEFNLAAERDLALRRMQMGLANVGYGATNTLAGMDVSRGTNLGNLYTARGGALSNLDQLYGTYGANLATGEATNLSNLQTGLGTNLANIGTGTADTQAEILMRGAGGQAGLAQNMLAPTYSMTVPYAGGGWGAVGSLGGTAATLGAMGMGYYGMGGAAGGQGSLPVDSQYIMQGGGSNLNQVYGTPYAPPGYYQAW